MCWEQVLGQCCTNAICLAKKEACKKALETLSG